MIGSFVRMTVLCLSLGIPCVAFGHGDGNALTDLLTMAIRALPVWTEWWTAGQREGPFPTILPADGVITSHFGGRRHPVWHEWRAHCGVDIADQRAAPVRAAQQGVVRTAGWRGGYGLAVEVDHGHGWHSLYAHLAHVDVRRGEVVRAGARIGTMGATGWATGPHLHFELRYFNTPIDPLPYLLHLARH